jgi:hypothetical protein
VTALGKWNRCNHITGIYAVIAFSASLRTHEIESGWPLVPSATGLQHSFWFRALLALIGSVALTSKSNDWIIRDTPKRGQHTETAPDNLRRGCPDYDDHGDQSDFFAGIQLKRSVHEEQRLAILLIDVWERDHFGGATRGTLPLPV